MIYDSLATTWLGETPPDASGSPAAWGAYVEALRDQILVSKAGAISAYNTLKQVRSNLGLPFMSSAGGEGGSDLGAWSSEYEQQAVDIIAMSKVFVDGVNDALAGKRKLMWDDQVKDYAIEGFPGESRLQYDANGAPVLVDAAGYPEHAKGQVGNPVVFGVIAGLAVVQSVGIGFLVYKAFETFQVVAQQKTERTVAEATKKNAELVEKGLATPAEAKALNDSIYKGATDLRKAATEPKAKETDAIASAVKTIAWVGLGVGVLYVVAQVVGKMPGAPSLAGARDNPATTRSEWIKALDEDERALRRVQQDVAKLRRGESVGYYTLASALNEERGLKQVIANKRALISRLHDNPDYTKERVFYLPKEVRDVPPLTPSGTDLEVWTWETERTSPKTGQPQTMYHGIAFAGKAGKPLWHHWFGTSASRLKMITDSIASRKAHLKYREERTGARKDFKHTLKVGDVLYTSWGYDQTNVDFYEVVETKAKSVVVCKIGSREVEAKQNLSYVAAVTGKCYGKSSVHRVGEGNSVKIDDHYAHKWDGKPVYETASGWGH